MAEATRSSSGPLLRVEPHAGEPFSHHVAGEACVIGRSSKADLVISDRYMSRLHARLYREGGAWFVEDLGGRNRTLLNGRMLDTPSRLAEGDAIGLSETRVTVERLDAAPPPAASASELSGSAILRPASVLMAAQESLEAEADDGARSRRLRLQRLNEFHRTLAGPISLEALLELVLDRTFADLRPEEAVIFLRRPDGEYARAAMRRLPGTDSEFLYSRSLIAEVTEKGLAALVYDVSADERFSASESMLSSGVRSLVAAPLLDPSGCPGMIVLSSRGHVRRFSEEDMEELVLLAAAAALRIRNIALAEEAAQRRVLEKELALARQIQVALLPKEQPDLPGYELLASNFPTRAVSGDLYQWQTRAEGRECVFLLADVSGKGMAASMLTASLEALAAGPIEVGMPPEEICSRLSRRLYARTSAERYATGFVAVLHPQSGRFCYANAGHNAALLLRRSGAVERLAATGLPLGLLPIGDYGREERRLEPGDLVFIYTDGITEAANPGGEEYGLERVVSLFGDLLDRNVNELVAALDEDLRDFVQGVPFADDRTLILLRRLP